MKFFVSIIICWNLIITSLLLVSFKEEDSWRDMENEGNLAVKELRVVDDDGNIIGVFGNGSNGPRFSMMYPDTKTNLSISQSQDGKVSFSIVREQGGESETQDELSFSSCSFGIDERNSSFVSVRGRDDTVKIELKSNEEDCDIRLFRNTLSNKDIKDPLESNCFSSLRFGCDKVGSFITMVSEDDEKSSIHFQTEEDMGASLFFGRKGVGLPSHDTYSASLTMSVMSDSDTGVGNSRIFKYTNGKYTQF